MSETGTVVPITLNGRVREVPAGLSVRELLTHIGVEPALVVVEHNRDILDRGSYEEALVREGDTVEVVHFVGGG